MNRERNYPVVVFLLGLSVVLGLVILAGCATTPTTPQAPCASFGGTWNTDAGPVDIIQTDCSAVGTFPSPLRFHTLRGVINGDRFEFDWEGPLGAGRGVVRINPAGDAFLGTFGYGDSTSGGTFTGARGTVPVIR